MKLLISFIFLTIALSIAITVISTLAPTSLEDEQEQPINRTTIRRSRFLAEKEKEKENPPRNNKSRKCKKDNEICSNYLFEGRNTTCCQNKCVDLGYDSKHCGACKNKCLVTESCCRGECVNLAFDKRHCGACNNRCMTGGYCIYGMCDYA